MEQLTHLLKRASTIAARRHQFGFSTGLNWCSKLAHFSVFAKDAVSNGVVESTGAMLAGAVAQTLVEEPIKFVAN